MTARQRRGSNRPHRRRTKAASVPSSPVEATIEKVSHDGRGIARVEGKTTFVDGALDGETVEFTYTQCHERYDEARVTQVMIPSADRVLPPCRHASACGGCSLQHLKGEAQVALKQSTLVEQLARFGASFSGLLSPPITGAEFGYRRKARFAVKYSTKGLAVVGFRAKSSSHVIDIDHCPVLVESLADAAHALQVLLNGLRSDKAISHIDAVEGGTENALVFRHVKDLPNEDFQAILGFCQARGTHLYLQPDTVDSVYRVWPEEGTERLTFSLPDFDVTLHFHPLDFIQVNGVNNEKMVHQALEFLDLKANDRVLDLFCGVGNFSLPLATRAAQVVGVEGTDAMVARARENASLNALSNVEFHRADLSVPLKGQKWAKRGFSKILIDPPRAGALEIVRNMASFGPEKIVYVSCNPATLARDASELNALGYSMVNVGIVDMFPHTTHIESIALFEKSKK